MSKVHGFVDQFRMMGVNIISFRNSLSCCECFIVLKLFFDQFFHLLTTISESQFCEINSRSQRFYGQ